LFACDSIEKDKLHLVSRYFLVLNGRVCVVMLFIRFLWFVYIYLPFFRYSHRKYGREKHKI